MALTIEDGSIVSGADSYITVLEYTTWADSRHGSSRTTAPANDAAAELLILSAMDVFESLNLIGTKATQNQALQFPRYGLWIDSYPIDSDEIPATLKSALYEIVYADELGYGLFNSVQRKTLREKVGDLEVEYANNSSSVVKVPAVAAYLKKLVQSSSGIVRV